VLKIRMYMKSEAGLFILEVHEPGGGLVYQYELEAATHAPLNLRKRTRDVFVPLDEGERETTIARHSSFHLFSRAKLGDVYAGVREYYFRANGTPAVIERTARRARGAPFACKVEDFRYDAGRNHWWNLKDGYSYGSRDVKAMVKEWPIENGRRVSPAEYAAHADSGLVVWGAVWWPDNPMIIEGHAITGEGCVISRPGARLFNLFAILEGAS